MKLLTGNERFKSKGKSLEFNMLDFWRFEFSNIYDMQDEISEFIVAKALGIDIPYNKEMWTLYDIDYKGFRIEVKETSYYHPWNKDGKVSKQRSFGITKANSSYEHPDEENKFERQNDIYVFCLVNGNTRETSNPLDLDNWDFYIVPTLVINKECKDNKTISLNKIKKLGFEAKHYNEIKKEVDRVIAFQMEDAYRYSSNHKPELENDSICGCFDCLSIFSPKEIKDWAIADNPIDKRGTACCPYCMVDTIIGESSGYPITKRFLKQMNHYFMQSNKNDN